MKDKKKAEEKSGLFGGHGVGVPVMRVRAAFMLVMRMLVMRMLVAMRRGRAFARAGAAGTGSHAGVHVVDQLADGAGAAAALRAAAEAAIHLPHRSHGRRRLRHRAADLTIGKHIAGTHDHRDAKPKLSGV